MARVRKIHCEEDRPRNYYLVDACFLANKHLPASLAPTVHERERIEACQAWWKKIDRQLDAGFARVFAPDVCIAEAFKVLAKKYYQERWFKSPSSFGAVKRKLSNDIRTPTQSLKAMNRPVRFHDISTNRDIIVAVDRFFELFHRKKKHVQIVDLLVVATAKYLMDFYDIPKATLHIVTLDKALREGIAAVPELPSAYDPTLRAHRAEVVFEYTLA